MSAITTHVLDTALGRPASGVPVRLEAVDADTLEPVKELASTTTNQDGRVAGFGPETLEAGNYRITFDTATYHAATKQDSFFPQVAITFTLTDPGQHYHVPLLLSPFTYSTYRGS